MESTEEQLLPLSAESAERESASAAEPLDLIDTGLWRDVFIEQSLPWRRFLQSAVLHTAALGLIWAVSVSMLRQQQILDHPAFDKSSLVTYSPQEYLPPLDTGAAAAAKLEKGDPAYARQPILSVPREADNRSQTIVAPPDLKLDRDVSLPNIVATGALTPAVPLDATHPSMRRLVAPDTQVVAPAPDVQANHNRSSAALNADVVAPPPELTARRTRGVAAPEAAVVAPPPELTQSRRTPVGTLNVGPAEVVAPAPQLSLAAQHSLAARGKGRLPGGAEQPVAPPPSAAASGGSGASGRLVALGIHPVAPSGPVPVPGGNRRGTFSASPQEKKNGAGTPDLSAAKADANGAGNRRNSSLPAGLRVGAADSNSTSPVERNGSSAGGKGGGNGDGRGADDTRDLAGTSTLATGRAKGRIASPVSDERLTDLDRQVFGGRRPYTTPLNMPNLNSTSGSWEIRFAELDATHKEGDLLAPLAVEQSDPGYPLELIRANVHGMVTLYAVIRSDGKVGDIRVLSSPDERLDLYATKALARWKFAPAERAGKAVAIEALVRIPFRVRRSF